MSRNMWVEDWEPILSPRASEEARRRVPTRAFPAANGAADDFTGGDARTHVPSGREITVSNRSGVRKVLPEDY